MLNLDHQLDFIAEQELNNASFTYLTREIKKRSRKIEKAKNDSTKSTYIEPMRQIQNSRLQPFLQYLQQPSISSRVRHQETISVKIKLPDSDQQLVQLLKQPTKPNCQVTEAIKKIQQYHGNNKYLLKMKNYQASNK